MDNVAVNMFIIKFSFSAHHDQKMCHTMYLSK
jgi:hypothetical protein